MINTIRIFKNYGCLASEYVPVYTFGAEDSSAVCSDVLVVCVPDGWSLVKNSYDEDMVQSPWGWIYDVNDLLSSDDFDFPVFKAIDNDGCFRSFSLDIL